MVNQWSGWFQTVCRHDKITCIFSGITHAFDQFFLSLCLSVSAFVSVLVISSTVATAGV